MWPAERPIGKSAERIAARVVADRRGHLHDRRGRPPAFRSGITVTMPAAAVAADSLTARPLSGARGHFPIRRRSE